jgi:hypothetical protein
MKLVSVSVKSNKEDLGNVDVQTFDNIQEAVDFFQAEIVKSDPEAKADAGAVAALALINSQYKANVTNAYRVSKTRTTSPITALREKIKTADKSTKDKIAAFLESLDLPSNLE